MYTCFEDLEKACNHVSRNKLWAVLPEYEVRDHLLAAKKLSYKQSEVCVLVNGIKTKLFSVSVRLKQGFVLSPLLFIIYMERIDRDNSSCNSVTFAKCNVWRLLFTALRC